MNDSIGSSDVNEAGLFVSWVVDFFCDNLSTKPVAVEITKMRISKIQSSRVLEGLTHPQST